MVIDGESDMRIEYDNEVLKVEMQTGAKLIVNEHAGSITVAIPVQRIGHDHNDTVWVSIHGIAAVTDEREVFTKVNVPCIKISDPRFIEVVGYGPVVENRQSSER